ncbi:hypothetical protein Tco_1560007 [Tanacetum coccineum]
MRHLGRPNNRELGYIDAKMSKYVNKEGGQGMHLLWDMKLVTKSIKCFLGTDNAKITRKRSKPDKHGHENGKSAKEPEDCYQWSTKSTLGQHWSTTKRQNPQKYQISP